VVFEPTLVKRRSIRTMLWNFFRTFLNEDTWRVSSNSWTRDECWDWSAMFLYLISLLTIDVGLRYSVWVSFVSIVVMTSARSLHRKASDPFLTIISSIKVVC